MTQESNTRILPGKSVQKFSAHRPAIMLAIAALASSPATCAPLNFFALPYSFVDDQAGRCICQNGTASP